MELVSLKGQCCDIVDLVLYLLYTFELNKNVIEYLYFFCQVNQSCIFVVLLWNMASSLPSDVSVISLVPLLQLLPASVSHTLTAAHKMSVGQK